MKKCLIVIILFCFACSDSGTNITFGDITGQINLIVSIVDEDGAPAIPRFPLIIEDVNVDLLRNGAIINSTTINNENPYSFPNIESGTYAVRASIMDKLIMSEISKSFKLGILTAAPIINIPELGNLSIDDFNIVFSLIFVDPTGPSEVLRSIAYSIENAGSVKLYIYDSNNILVRTLLDDPDSIGEYNIVWDYKYDSGSLLSNGYYYVLGIFKASDTGYSIMKIILFDV